MKLGSLVRVASLAVVALAAGPGAAEPKRGGTFTYAYISGP